MKTIPGGLQFIDCSSVTLTVGSGAVTVTNSLMAEQFRNNKTKILHSMNVVEDGVTTIEGGISTGYSTTGAFDGKIVYVTAGNIDLKVTTDDNTVTFAPDTPPVSDDPDTPGDSGESETPEV